PQLQLIIERLRNTAALLVDMAVEIDEAGQYVLALGVDLGVALRLALGSRRHRVGRRHILDPAALDDDVLRAGRGSTVAVDHHRVADNQTLIAPAAFRRRLSKEAAG